VPDVFISYRRQDTAGYARWLYDALAARLGEGHVFIDVDTIGPGEDFAQRIQDSLSLCDVAIVLIGCHWLVDEAGVRRIDDPEDLVRLEVAAALRENRVRVVPVLVEGATMPARSDLPGDLADLPRFNAIELSAQHGAAALNRLLATIGGGRAAPTQAAPARPEPIQRPSRTRRLAYAAAGAPVAAGAAVALILALSGSGGHPSGPRGGPAGHAAAPGPISATSAFIYTPTDAASGSLLVKVHSNASGHCFAPSIVAARSDAWRCFVGNIIHDPCFEAAGLSAKVVCPVSGPWSGTADIIALTTPLPGGSANPSRPGMQVAWAIELVDGSKCELLSGAVPTVAGLPLSYSCTDHVDLYGKPSRSAAVWTIFAGPENSTSIGKRPIAAAWF